MAEFKQDYSQETFSMSRGTINIIVTGIVFMVTGIFLGLALAGQGLTATEVRNIVHDEFEIAVQNNLTDTLVAVMQNAPSASLSADDVRTIIQEELAGINVASAGGVSGSTANTADLDAAAIETIVSGIIESAERERLYRTDDDPFIGSQDAPVTIVEFSDFLCGYCGRHYEQTLTPLLENFDGYVRYVYRDFPGVGGQNAVQSALAAECADDQGQFWQYHNSLFGNQAALGTDDLAELETVLVGYAQDLNLDIPAFTDCYESNRYLSDIIADSGDAQAVGARGTPGFLINGTFVSGAQPYEVFEQFILNELEKQGIAYQPPA